MYKGPTYKVQCTSKNGTTLLRTEKKETGSWSPGGEQRGGDSHHHPDRREEFMWTVET